MRGFQTLPLNSDTSVVGKSPTENYLKMIDFFVVQNYIIFKTSNFLISDARNELSVSMLVGKMYLDARNGQFWQILYHVENGQLNTKFGRKRWKFENYIKNLILIQILQFYCLHPLIWPWQAGFCHRNSLFNNFSKNFLFLPTEG